MPQPLRTYTVGPRGNFSSINDAIEQAKIDGTGPEQPALIEVAPGNYIEDVVLDRAFIAVQGTSSAQPQYHPWAPIPPEGATVSGLFTVDLEVAGTGFQDTQASIANLTIEGSNGGLLFTGTNPQSLLVSNCAIAASDGVPFLVENTGQEGASLSHVQLSKVAVRAHNGNTNPALVQTAGGIVATDATFSASTEADTAVRLSGDSRFNLMVGRLFGDLFTSVPVATGGPGVLAGDVIIIADGSPVHVEAGSFVIWVSGFYATGAPFAVTGDGLFTFGSVMNLTAFDSPLLVAPTVTSPIQSGSWAQNAAYFPATPGNWDPPAPTNVQAAIERLAAAVSGLLAGPIP